MPRTAGKGSPLHLRSLEHRSPRATGVPRFSSNILVMGIEAVVALSLTRGETRGRNTWGLVERHQASSTVCQSPEQLRAVVSLPSHRVT